MKEQIPSRVVLALSKKNKWDDAALGYKKNCNNTIVYVK